MKNNKEVPAIRFANFSEAWEKRQFSDVFIGLQNNTLSRADLNYDNGEIKNVHYGDVLIKFGDYIDAASAELPYINDSSIGSKFAKSLLEDGDIIIADTAEDETVGKCCEITNSNGMKLLSGLHTIAVRPQQKYASKFLGYYLNSNAYHSQLLPFMHGIKVTSISKGSLQDTVLTVPTSRDEQGKIGECLSNIDNLITLHQNKLEKMQQVRELLLNQLFTGLGQKFPDVRFTGNQEEWKLMSLRNIVTSYTDYLPTPTDGYTRLGIRSHMKGTFYDYVAPSKKLGEKRLQRVKRDNLIVNIVFAWEHAVAVTTEEDEGKLVSHRFPQFSFNEGMYPMFFRYALSDPRFRHHLFLASPSGAGRNKTLRIDEMMDYQLSVPEYEEQKKIAGCLETVDHLIGLYEMELEKIRNVKSACLQGMFV